MNLIIKIDAFIAGFLAKKYFAIYIYIFMGVLSLLPLLYRATFIVGPDIAMHFFNVQQYAKELHAGVIYPRWLGDWYSGYGAPIGVVYSPFTYYSAGLLTLLGLNVSLALKIILLLSVIVSGYFLFRFTVIFYRPFAAFVAGIVFQFAPYRIVDLYGRGAIPEYVAFMWLPVLFYLSYQYIHSRKISLICFIALSWAGLIFTHLLIAVLFIPVYVLVVFYIWFQVKGTLIREFTGLFCAFLIGLLTSAVYWLPASQESKYINTEWLQHLTDGQIPVNQGWGNYLNNFLFSAQVYKTTMESIYRDNIEIGVGAILSLFIILWAVFINPYNNEQQKSKLYLTLVTAFCGLVGIFMSFKISSPLWAILDGIQVIQFPWRWQTITTLMAAFLGGSLFDITANVTIKQNFHKGSAFKRILISFGLVSFYCMFSGYTIWHHRGALSDDQIRQFSGLEELSIENYGWVYDDFYLPKWAVDFDYRNRPKLEDVIDFDHQDINARILKKQSSYREFEIVSKTRTTINIRLFWFPGWQVYVNGDEVNANINPDDGTMLVVVPAGISNMKVVFNNTPIRKSASQISIIGFVLFSVLMIISIMRIADFKNKDNEGNGSGHKVSAASCLLEPTKYIIRGDNL